MNFVISIVLPLFSILRSGLASFASFLLRAVVVKFVTFTALFFVTSEFVALLVERVLRPYDNAGNLTGALNSIPSTVWYFLDAFAIDVGLPMVISALVTRFIVRRIPVIG